MASIEERMKDYESRAAKRTAMPKLPICIRIDGNNFSKWTKGLQRPFDPRLSKMMERLTVELVKKFNATIGYTQSDEITLALYSPYYDGQLTYGGREQKLTSVIPSFASSFFQKMLQQEKTIPSKKDSIPFFDCRTWNVPDKQEAVNMFIWRQQDAVKNSISMAAQSVYSHRQLMHKDSSAKLTMLEEKGIDWYDYPEHFKRGIFVQRRKRTYKFSAEEIDRLPPNHRARSNPDLQIERSRVEVLSFPMLRDITNKEELIFQGADPQF